MYSCSDSAKALLSSACLHNNSKWCRPSLVSPSSCTVLLLQWVYFREKSTLCNKFTQNREVDLFLRVGLLLRDYCICIAMLRRRRPILCSVPATKTRWVPTENNIKCTKHIQARRHSSEWPLLVCSKQRMASNKFVWQWPGQIAGCQ